MFPGGKFQAVIFDMDGVLCDSEEFIAQAACRMFAETYNIKVMPSDFMPFIGTGEDRYIGGVAEKYDVNWNLPRDKAKTYEIYLQMIRGKLQPLDGVRDFVAFCRKNNLKLAVASSADMVKVRGNLAEIKLPAEIFDACVTGNDIERKKPHPDIFLKAAELLNIKPYTALVVEDAINGIQAAKTAGAKCLGLTTSFSAEKLKAARADWTAANLACVPKELLDRLC